MAIFSIRWIYILVQVYNIKNGSEWSGGRALDFRSEQQHEPFSINSFKIMCNRNLNFNGYLYQRVIVYLATYSGKIQTYWLTAASQIMFPHFRILFLRSFNLITHYRTATALNLPNFNRLSSGSNTLKLNLFWYRHVKEQKIEYILGKNKFQRNEDASHCAKSFEKRTTSKEVAKLTYLSRSSGSDRCRKFLHKSLPQRGLLGKSWWLNVAFYWGWLLKSQGGYLQINK